MGMNPTATPKAAAAGMNIKRRNPAVDTTIPMDPKPVNAPMNTKQKNPAADTTMRTPMLPAIAAGTNTAMHMAMGVTVNGRGATLFRFRPWSFCSLAD